VGISGDRMHAYNLFFSQKKKKLLVHPFVFDSKIILAYFRAGNFCPDVQRQLVVTTFRLWLLIQFAGTPFCRLFIFKPSHFASTFSAKLIFRRNHHVLFESI
jgi:hypothetical protein